MTSKSDVLPGVALATGWLRSDQETRNRRSGVVCLRLVCCAPVGIRTPNLLIRSQMLYPLSYRRPSRGLDENSGRGRQIRNHIRATECGSTDRGRETHDGPVTVRAIVRLAVCGVLATGLSACSGSGTTPTSTPSGAPSPTPEAAARGGGGGGAAGIRQPTFHGSLELRLGRGHQLPLPGECVANPRRHRVCAPNGQHTYVAYDRAMAANLTDAVMAPSRDHTAWLVRMGFAKASGATLRASAVRAAATDEFLLGLDSRKQVLAPLDPVTVGGTTVTVGPVTKHEAWDLVERLAAPGSATNSPNRH